MIEELLIGNNPEKTKHKILKSNEPHKPKFDSKRLEIIKKSVEQRDEKR